MAITQVSFRDVQTPIRDQGPRPTCAVFAVTAAHEWMREDATDLSEEHCLWTAKKIDGNDRGSTTVPSALAGITAEGQATEAEWPYGNPLFSAEPPDIDAHMCFRPGASRELGRPSLVEIAQILESGSAVVLRVAVVVNAWLAAAGGGVVDAPPGIHANDLHAVLAIGVRTLQGTDVIEFKNSWGDDWGDDGFGYLTETYWARYGRLAWALDS